MQSHLNRSFVAFALALSGGVSLMSDQTTGSKTAPAAQGKFKAIWEPVNVKEDLALTSVHFVSADEGWVAGGKNAMSGGVIVHTSDGGANWEIQLGDPASADRAYSDFRFLDAKTGFAVQSALGGSDTLVRTTDGKTWAPVGTLRDHRSDYQFVSTQVGFLTYGNEIFRTTDGGKKWTSIYECRVKAEVKGLTRQVNCQIDELFFVDANTGFGITRSIEDAGFVFVKTTDGTKWSASMILPGEQGREGALHFFDAGNGLIRTQSGKVFRTSDGGVTWSEVPGQIDGKPDFEFADKEVGWMAVYQRVLYTRDAGRSWLSTTTKFPAMIEASSLPARDRGYVVGDHGMVYRYRIVPADFTAKGILPAPAIAAASK